MVGCGMLVMVLPFCRSETHKGNRVTGRETLFGFGGWPLPGVKIILIKFLQIEVSVLCGLWI